MSEKGRWKIERNYGPESVQQVYEEDEKEEVSRLIMHSLKLGFWVRVTPPSKRGWDE